MSESKSVNLTAIQGKIKVSGLTPTLTIGMSEITEAIEKSELSLTEQTVLITFVSHITTTGMLNVEKILSLAYDYFIDSPELLDKLIEVIKSIG